MRPLFRALLKPTRRPIGRRRPTKTEWAGALALAAYALIELMLR